MKEFRFNLNLNLLKKDFFASILMSVLIYNFDTSRGTLVLSIVAAIVLYFVSLVIIGGLHKKNMNF